MIVFATQTSFAKIRSGRYAHRNSINKRRKVKRDTKKRKEKNGWSIINPLRFSPSVVPFLRLSVVLSLPCLQLVSVSLFRFALASSSSFQNKTTLSLLFTMSSYRHAAPYYSSYVNEFRLIIWERSHTEDENGGNVEVRGLAPKRG